MSLQPDSADGAGALGRALDVEPAATTVDVSRSPSAAAASPPPPQAAAAAPSSLGSLDRLPPDLLASHVWTQLPRRDRRALRLASRGLARLTAEAVMSRLTVAVCRASLLTLTSHNHKLHQRFPRPTRLTLRLLPPAGANRRIGELSEMAAAAAAAAAADGGSGAGGGGGAAAAGGAAEFLAGVGGGGGGGGGPEWEGSTAVMSYFLSELGASTTLTSLSLQGWQELQPRDLHHVAACYPRLSRLHLAGLPGNNYLHGHVLASLGKAGAAGLRELVVDTQVVMDAAAALAALSAAALPSLAALQLCGLPLLGSWEPLPLAGLGGGLTRLELTFEHRHAGAEAALVELGRLRGLRCLALDFMQLGTGSSLWSAGWLLCHVLCRLPALTTLRLPRAFLYDKSHPAYLATLAARLPALRELGLGSAILSEETVAALNGGGGAAGAAAAAMAAAARAGQRLGGGGGEEGGGRGGGAGGTAGMEPVTPAARPGADAEAGAGAGVAGGGDTGLEGGAGGGEGVGVGSSRSGAEVAAAAAMAAAGGASCGGQGSPMSISPYCSAGGADDSGGRAGGGGDSSTPAAGAAGAAGAGVGACDSMAPTTPAVAAAATASAAAADAGSSGSNSGSSSGDTSAGDAAGVLLGAVPPPGATLVRPWRRLALGAAMPCYLELLLRALGIEPVEQQERDKQQEGEERRQQEREQQAGEGQGRGEAGPATPAPERPASGVRGSGAGYGGARATADARGAGAGGAAATARRGSLELLELCTPATLPMVQLLPRYVRSSNSGSGSSRAGGVGGGGGVKEVRLLLRLGGNWADVVSGLRRLGPALTGLALMPTFLYSTGTMITEQVVAAVAAGLPHLTHLELYRLNADPTQLAAALEQLPVLRYLLLGVADEARERRGCGHPAALVRAALEALHLQRQRQQRWRVAHSCPRLAAAATATAAAAAGVRYSADQLQEEAAAAASVHPAPSAHCQHDPHHHHHNHNHHNHHHNHQQHHNHHHNHQPPADDSVVCCGELSESEAAAFTEAAELQYGVYDSAGSRLRVTRAPWDRSLPARLAVGCSMAQTGWEQ